MSYLTRWWLSDTAPDPSLDEIPLYDGLVAPDRSERTATIDWTNPVVGGRTHGFVAVAEGMVIPDYSEEYTFHLLSDDSSRIYVDGVLLIQLGGGGQSSTAKMTLTAGHAYHLRLEWVQGSSSPSPITNPSRLRVRWSSASQALELVPSEDLQIGRARIRSHVSEDAGSLFQATQAVAVESAVSEAFPYGTEVTSGVPYPFFEALRPGEIALRYFPLPTRNQEMLVTVEGETALGRMARVYPSPIMARVADIDDFGGATAVTAQEAIQYIFERWADEFSWFTFEDVPDLRLLVPEAVGNERQHYIDNPSDGVVSIEAIAIPQDTDNRRSMREIVDEWLAIFPGTVVRQNSAGNIELVPRVGPDAPEGALALEWRDVISMSDGEDDPRGVVNKARVEVRGFEFDDEQAVAPPAFMYLAAVNGLQRSVVEGEGDIPSETRQEIQGVGHDLEFTGLVPPTAVTVEAQVIVYGSWDADTALEYGPVGITGGSATLELVPGQSGTVSVTVNARSATSTAVFTITRDEGGNSLRVSQVTGWMAGHQNAFGDTWFGYLLLLDVTGTQWVEASPVTATFGYGTSSLPGEGGADLLSESVALYGEREATIRSSVFNLSPEQAQAVAQGYVLFNINPRTVREVRQSEWNRYPVRFDHIGRLVDLPNGERAVVENRSCADSFAPDGGFMQSSFTATVTELVIDTTTEFLHLDDGDYMRLDDGQLVEAS